MLKFLRNIVSDTFCFNKTFYYSSCLINKGYTSDVI